ncbi:hypothetical protein [Paenibacillus nuruki]|uniref:hypothetical protein n=1 Tax=Paenibacillus nuruki TaxID=1886670 RepID=UPI002804E040|nr:hypothetical protein [Paenibacillus nuruki]CAJ1315948.1 hypothetical protein AASFL403_12050 [Paenibacillus nuruki]
MKESDMYPYLKKYFEGKGYTVYPEIEPPGNGTKRADIVAIKDQEVVIIEMKVGFGLTVIQQACDWKGYANQIYIAIPKPKKRNWMPPIGSKLLASEKLGLLEVDLKDYSNFAYVDVNFSRVREVNKAPYQPEASSAISIIKFITPYHLEGPNGGSQTGGHISGYQVTMRRVKEFLTDRDWTTAKEIADNVETHYYAQDKSASLKQSLLKWESEWCEYKVIKGRGYFRIKSGQS